MQTGPARENIREILIRGGKGVDAKHAVLIILAAEGEDLLMQNNIMGGSTVIDATEVAVIPPRPAGPPVVTM